MTEEEWLSSQQPWHLINDLRGKVSERKLRLLACACARRIREAADAYAERRGGEAQASRDRQMHCYVVLTESFVEGRASTAEMEAARENETWAVGEHSPDSCADYAAEATIEADPVAAARRAAEQSAEGFCLCAHDYSSPRDAQLVAFRTARRAEYETQVSLIRDIFGNPFRPVAFDPAWRTDTAVTLARQMYESRDFGATPILADALQDAGCESEDVLNHCRDAKQPHVRGCWVVDCVLGKE